MIWRYEEREINLCPKCRLTKNQLDEQPLTPNRMNCYHVIEMFVLFPNAYEFYVSFECNHTAITFNRYNIPMSTSVLLCPCIVPLKGLNQNANVANKWAKPIRNSKHIQVTSYN